MRGGQNRKAARLKALAGTLRPERDRGRTARGAVGLAPPLWLRPIARTKWEEMAAKFARRGGLDPVVADLLANYCMHWEVSVRCYHRISKDGPVVKGVRGHRTKHPALQLLRDNSEALRRCLERLARMGGGSEGRSDDSEDEEFFALSSPR